MGLLELMELRNMTFLEIIIKRIASLVTSQGIVSSSQPKRIHGDYYNQSSRKEIKKI